MCHPNFKKLYKKLYRLYKSDTNWNYEGAGFRDYKSSQFTCRLFADRISFNFGDIDDLKNVILKSESMLFISHSITKKELTIYENNFSHFEINGDELIINYKDGRQENFLLFVKRDDYKQIFIDFFVNNVNLPENFKLIYADNREVDVNFRYLYTHPVEHKLFLNFMDKGLNSYDVSIDDIISKSVLISEFEI